MEFLEGLLDYIGPYIWLLPVPIIIFSATPGMPFWYKSGRILFMWSIIAFVIGVFIYISFTSEEEIPCCLSREFILMKHLGGLFSWTVITNIYIGAWEFVWRCVYRQWTWPPMKNIKNFGLVSNLCILGAILPFLGLLALYLLVLMLHYFYP